MVNGTSQPQLYTGKVAIDDYRRRSRAWSRLIHWLLLLGFVVFAAGFVKLMGEVW